MTDQTIQQAEALMEEQSEVKKGWEA